MIRFKVTTLVPTGKCQSEVVGDLQFSQCYHAGTVISNIPCGLTVIRRWCDGPRRGQLSIDCPHRGIVFGPASLAGEVPATDHGINRTIINPRLAIISTRQATPGQALLKFHPPFSRGFPIGARRDASHQQTTSSVASHLFFHKSQQIISDYIITVP